MNEIITWVFVDSFLFTIQIILAFFFSLKLRVKNSYKIAFFGLLLFIISSYNILVIPMHYYHIVIPRTAIYNIKLMSLGEKSEISDYYGLRNRIVFTKKFYPKYLWSVYLGFLVVVWNRIRRRQLSRIKGIVKVLLETWKV